MKKIRILDCTLRDGGYVNNWMFGRKETLSIREALEKAGVDFIEMGLIQDISYDPNRTIYDNPQRVGKIIKDPENGMNPLYGALIEMSNYYPQELLTERQEGDPNILRYSFWKRLLDEGIEYAGNIAKKGYRLCCQPTRVEQYSDAEFAELCRRLSELDPYGVYIVDTFGLLREEDVLRYARVGNENLAPGIVLGYHAHDNMGQAFRNACAFLGEDYGDRTVQIDASIFGMGRGAGNLKLEQIAEHINEKYGKKYDMAPIYEVWDTTLSRVYKELPWGFNMAYFVTASNHCNPNYALYYLKNGVGISSIRNIVSSITGPDKFLYSDEKAEKFLKDERENRAERQ